ncbi:MAG: hypothetical protein IT428_25615 [Planctomycetaceae bacterium]|nr:hypothetical protein [Planctomycetaceae bacterium]
MMVRFLLIALLFGAIVPREAGANNNLFLPGDAYFPTSITAEFVARLKMEKAEAVVFRHNSYVDGGFFCGYAGYEQARVAKADADFLANLAKAYRIVRSDIEPRTLREDTTDGKVVQIETNPVRVMFYPESFEFPRFILGLQYNEKWVQETMRFGYDRDRDGIHMTCPVDSVNAIVACWRDADRVGPLDVTLPKVEIEPGKGVEKPITINGPVKAYVLASDPLSRYMDPGEGFDGILIVRSSGITRLNFAENAWKEVEVKDDRPSSK